MKIQLDVNLEECSNAFLTDVCLHTDDPAVLEKIAKFVGDNPYHSKSDCEIYFEGDVWGTAEAIIENKVTSNNAIEHLCYCREYWVRQVAAEFPKISKGCMIHLADDKNWEVISSLIANEALDEETFDHIFSRVVSGELDLEEGTSPDIEDFIKRIGNSKYLKQEQKKILRRWKETRFPQK